MARGYIKFKSKGFETILKSGGVRGAVQSAAQEIAGRAPGTEVKVKTGDYGGGRIIAYVRTNTDNPKKAEAQREALESAVGGGN